MNEHDGFHWVDFDIPEIRYILVVVFGVMSVDFFYILNGSMPCRSLNPVICFFALTFDRL